MRAMSERMIRVLRPEIYQGKRTDPKLGEIIRARPGVERSIKMLFNFFLKFTLPKI